MENDPTIDTRCKKAFGHLTMVYKGFFNFWKIIQPLTELANHWQDESFQSWKMIQLLKKVVLNHLGIQPRCIKGFSILGKSSNRWKISQPLTLYITSAISRTVHFRAKWMPFLGSFDNQLNVDVRHVTLYRNYENSTLYHFICQAFPILGKSSNH